MRRLILTLALVLGIAISFLGYSLATGFRSWPWTTTVATTTGSHSTGLAIGAPKDATFTRILELQQAGQVDALLLLDEQILTYPEKFRGLRLTNDDRSRVAASDKWHLGLREDNRWLVLSFTDGTLTLVEEHRYHGPTE